jgi:hypothetical protein
LTFLVTAIDGPGFMMHANRLSTINNQIYRALQRAEISNVTGAMAFNLAKMKTAIV